MLPGLQQTPNCRGIGPGITLGAGPSAARPGSSQPLALKGGWTGPAQVAHTRGNLTVMVWPALSRLAARDVGTEGSETTQPQTPVHQTGRPGTRWSQLPGQGPGQGSAAPQEELPVGARPGSRAGVGGSAGRASSGCQARVRGRGRGPHRKSFQWVPGFPSASRPPALPRTPGLGLTAFSMLHPGGQWEPLPCRRRSCQGCGPPACCPGGFPRDTIDLHRGGI